MIRNAQTDDAGVSPVIGVILLVAVTVALVALATVIVFDIGDDVSDTADATVQMEQSGDEIKATVIRNSNVASFDLQAPESATVDNFGENADAGATATASDLNDEETVSVVATLEDGSEEVLTSTDYNDLNA